MRSSRVVAGLALVLIAGALLWRRGSRGFTTEDVRWTSGGVEIAGTLYLPAGDGPHAAAAFAPGYGDWTRAERLFRVHAERLATRGIAMLIYDKRGCGESGGDWRLASLAQLADDALGGHALLRGDARIRSGAVGMFGTSQGGLVAVLAASREPSVAFVATLSLSTRSPAEHDAFLTGERLRRAGFDDAEATRAGLMHARISEVLRTGRGWEAARAELDALAAEPWLRESGLELPPLDAPRARAYRDLPLDLDPISLLITLDVPLFAAQGSEDWEVPGERAARILTELRGRHDLDLTPALIDGAGHVLRVRAGWGPLERWSWPDAYWAALDAWLERVVHEASSPESGEALHQGSSSGERAER